MIDSSLFLMFLGNRVSTLLISRGPMNEEWREREKYTENNHNGG